MTAPEPLAKAVDLFHRAPLCSDGQKHPNEHDVEACGDCTLLGLRAAGPLLLEAVIAEVPRYDLEFRTPYAECREMVRTQGGEYVEVDDLTAALARLLATPVGPATTEEDG